jgi:proteasome lid subunit RPN8/RPN11
MDKYHDVLVHDEFIVTELDPAVRERLQDAIDYLLEDPTVERGVMIRNDLSWVPFENIIPPPSNVGLIRMGVEGFATMAELLGNNDLHGWLHSHPHWMAYPSRTDVEFHQFPGVMYIYSVEQDELNAFTTAYISSVGDNIPLECLETMQLQPTH